MGRFSGKKAVVVGGTGDIGLAICRRLVGEGAFVTVHCSAKSEKSEKIQKEFGNNAELLYMNISENDFDGLDKSLLKEKVSEADILCVVMGPFAQKTIEDTSLSDWKKFALLDYALPGLLSSYALPYMKKKMWGRIIFFGGTRTFSINAYKTNAAYAAAKTGVSVITKSIAVECAPYNITCNAIFPGFVDS
ncbi:MAG: SDR family NAD(P)-dependent oxidoreductase [Treponema sp.]|nr:SDR family NAD(P)-dependent oxidoreductase [Treponema sp.]